MSELEKALKARKEAARVLEVRRLKLRLALNDLAVLDRTIDKLTKGKAA